MQPTQWLDFTPPRSASRRRSIGLLCHRPAHLEALDKRQVFHTRPDILIKRGDTVLQVIDTKWKRIAARIDDRKLGVSQADVYQMMAYGRLYQCGKLTLLYPHHGAAGM